MSLSSAGYHFGTVIFVIFFRCIPFSKLEKNMFMAFHGVQPTQCERMYHMRRLCTKTWKPATHVCQRSQPHVGRQTHTYVYICPFH